MKYGCRGFHAYLLPNATHKRVGLLTLLLNTNLFAFLGHLQHITIDSVSDVSRGTCGLAIRRAKKRVNLTNDKRIKMCWQRFDSHAYTRLQFVQLAMSSAQRRCQVRAIQTRTTMTTPRLRMTIHSIRMMTTPVMTPIRQRPYQLTQRGVSCSTARYTHRANAVRSSTLLWVVCQRSAQPRTRLSSLPHAYQRVAASVLT